MEVNARSARWWRLAPMMLALGLVPARAAELGAQAPAAPDTAVRLSLDTLRVSGRVDNLIGIAKTASEGFVGAADLMSRPISREGELLETVPGVIVTQHSGEGKANQYFVRGFNLDHGTDFSTRVEGMPLNMPTHGHGQGYTDLSPLIPEFVQHLNYKLGVYHAEIGDFGSAGGAEFQLTRSLRSPFVSLGSGANGLARLVGGGSAAVAGGDLLMGGEAKAYDGPWEQGQRIRKLSGLARYTVDRGRSHFSLLGLAYRNRWNSSDQIPLRAVRSGLIDRFGQLDSDDGGSAQRYSLSGSWRHTGPRSVRTAQLYAIRSELDLFSNFTYFLDDPRLGDEFNQVDRRTVFGGEARQTTNARALGGDHLLTAGVQSRADLIGGLGLYRTEARVRRSTVREDRIRETGTGLFVEAASQWRPWVRTVLGLRGDGFTFDVRSDRPENSGRRLAGIVSPKGSLVLTPLRAVELYVSGGYGFHSNDARGTTITVDPITGDPVDRVDPLVRSRGAETGIRVAAVPGLTSTLTAWALNLDSELLFVGDAGVTEPSASSRRRGITWANFYRPLPQLSLDADLSLAHARLVAVTPGQEHIPGAMERVFAGGIAWSPGAGAFGAIRVRHFGAYPLVEDNSVRADPATLFNAEVGYRLASGLRLEATVLNLLDSDAADIQYFYASRLEREPLAGVEDVHFHPVEPRQLRVFLSWGFR